MAAVMNDAPKWREIYGSVVVTASQYLRRGSEGISTAKNAIIDLLSMKPADGGLKPWQAFVIRNSDGALLIDTTGNPLKTFREFIEAHPLRGLGESVADIERLLADEPEALARLREELKEERGGNRNPEGLGGKSHKTGQSIVKDNNIILDKQPDLFTQPPEKPKRQKKTDQGTRRDYTLSRLKKDAPALFEEVKAGRLSANAAAKQAGFRRPMRSVPIDSPDNAIRALLRVFTADDLVRALSKVAA